MEKGKRWKRNGKGEEGKGEAGKVKRGEIDWDMGRRGIEGGGLKKKQKLFVFTLIGLE